MKGGVGYKYPLSSFCNDLLPNRQHIELCLSPQILVLYLNDGDQATGDHVNVPTVQPSQGKESKAQELAQVINDIMAAQSAQNPARQPGFASLITQA